MSLLTNLRHSIRTLIRQPGLSALAVLALALGIGLTTMMFSIIQGAFLRGLPFENADRILAVNMVDVTEPDDQGQGVFQHDFVEWREQQTSFEPYAAFYSGTININDDGGRPERFDGAFVSANAFDVIRAQAALGRMFQKGDDELGGPPVVLLGDPVWRNRYDADPTIVGSEIKVNGQASTVVGVMPEGFKFPLDADVWVPLVLDVLRTERGTTVNLTTFGMLKDGLTSDEAQAEFTGLSARQREEYVETNENLTSVVRPYIREFLPDQIFAVFITMLGAVFGVLLIACANVANLLVARTAVRTKEIAIRTALGAGRRRIVFQLLGEAMVLAVVGTGLGLVLANAGIDLFNRSIIDTDPPFWIDIRLDPIVLAFTAGLTLVATLASGLLPALQASRSDVNEVLKDESRGSSGLRVGRMSRALVIVEIALSCGLLVASGLAIKSVVKLKTTDFGFASDNVYTSRLGLFEADYPDERARAKFFADLQERMIGLPGAQAVTIATNLPSTGSNRSRIEIEGVAYGTDEDRPAVNNTSVSPGFFATFDNEVLRGRDFAPSDDYDAPRVAIVNQSFVADHFEDSDPIGRRFRVESEDNDEPWISIVGLVPDMYIGDLLNERPKGYYVPLSQAPPRFASIAARAGSDPMALTASVRRQVEAVDANLPLYWVRTMTDYIAENNWFYSVFGSLFMAFGAAALFLATVGLYGVMAFSVSRRAPEFGVRMALGASGGRVLNLVLRQGLWQIGIGLFIGVGLGAALGWAVTLVMFDVEPFDPTVFAVVLVSLAAAALLACLIPAMRAMRVDPMTALRVK